MTKKLEDLFNLPPDSEDTVDGTSETQHPDLEQHRTTISAIDEAIDKIDAALPTVRDLETADAEMDELAKLAKDKFEDLMDLGMNVEPRYSGVIFQTAGMLLGHAITAKTAKLDKKLKMVDLQLKKARLDQTAKKGGDADDTPVDGQGIVLDRNALIAQIMGRGQEEQKPK